jgi:hypothetical protein
MLNSIFIVLLSVVMMSDVMLNVIILSDILLSVIMLNVVLLSVAAPYYDFDQLRQTLPNFIKLLKSKIYALRW